MYSTPLARRVDAYAAVVEGVHEVGLELLLAFRREQDDPDVLLHEIAFLFRQVSGVCGVLRLVTEYEDGAEGLHIVIPPFPVQDGRRA